MKALWGWLRGRAGFVWKNADVFAVMGVAVGVVIAEVVGQPSTDVVDSAILSLLGATAFVLLRDRDGRDELDDLRLLAGDAISDRPYQVVTQSISKPKRERQSGSPDEVGSPPGDAHHLAAGRNAISR